MPSLPPNRDDGTGGASHHPPDFAQQVAQARHDLRNPLGHIMGFTEILLEQVPKRGYDAMKPGLQAIYQQSEQLVARINQCLDPVRLREGRSNLLALRRETQHIATQVLATAQSLTARAQAAQDEFFITDLGRISGSAQRLLELSDKALAPLTGAT
jgi:signal transduction histidine kinase